MKYRFEFEAVTHVDVDCPNDASAIDSAQNYYASNMQDMGLLVNRIRVIDMGAGTGRVVLDTAASEEGETRT